MGVGVGARGVLAGGVLAGGATSHEYALKL